MLVVVVLELLLTTLIIQVVEQAVEVAVVLTEFLRIPVVQTQAVVAVVATLPIQAMGLLQAADQEVLELLLLAILALLP
jgi:hypothetical protein